MFKSYNVIDVKKNTFNHKPNLIYLAATSTPKKILNMVNSNATMCITIIKGLNSVITSLERLLCAICIMIPL